MRLRMWPLASRGDRSCTRWTGVKQLLAAQTPPRHVSRRLSVNEVERVLVLIGLSAQPQALPNPYPKRVPPPSSSTASTQRVSAASNAATAERSLGRTLSGCSVFHSVTAVVWVSPRDTYPEDPCRLSLQNLVISSLSFAQPFSLAKFARPRQSCSKFYPSYCCSATAARPFLLSTLCFSPLAPQNNLCFSEHCFSSLSCKKMCW